MLNRLSCFFFLAMTVALHHAQPVMAQEGINGNLVSVSWLEKNLRDPNVVILDASPSRIYAAKHIPGAVNYDIFTYGVQELPISEIEKRYQSWGISPGRKIVMYDQGGTFMATRLFFSLDYHGFPAEDLLVLDGGLFKWEEAGMPVTNEPAPARNAGSFTIRKLNEDVKVGLPEFLTASGDLRNNVLLEALEPGFHFGGQQFFGRPGHIPNAIMIPVADFYNTDKTFKSPGEIKKILDYYGVKPEQQVHTHCGGGIAASVPYFALRFLLDYPRVTLFPGSQLEWVADQRELPFWTYDAPFLMRETDWLKSWGGKMMRMYGVSQVSIVDVRPAEAYHQGHLPFALNIPADVFKSNITDPDRLAGILGPAGVNPSHEVVVISGAGLTKESALAFVMLEKLGQKKISVFTDSFEKSTQSGFSLIRDTTALPSTVYPAHVQTEVVITDARSTRGLFAKVFVASGGSLPAKVQDGTTVHVPYTDLLNTDGTPKAAKDIWTILTKAGVPRYAELVCYSDDPGEAAANYFILKLMGYPDVKVLVI